MVSIVLHLGIGSPLASSALVIDHDQGSNQLARHGVESIGYLRWHPTLQIAVVAPGGDSLDGQRSPPCSGWCL